MVIAGRVAAGLLLWAHGLVHLLYLVPDVPEFSLTRSWLIPEAARRPVGLAMTAGTVTAFTLLALAVWGVSGLSSLWPVLAVGASTLSALVLVVFWNRWLTFGVAVDVVLLILAVARPHWLDQFVAGAA